MYKLAGYVLNTRVLHIHKYMISLGKLLVIII